MPPMQIPYLPPYHYPPVVYPPPTGRIVSKDAQENEKVTSALSEAPALDAASNPRNHGPTVPLHFIHQQTHFLQQQIDSVHTYLAGLQNLLAEQVPYDILRTELLCTYTVCFVAIVLHVDVVSTICHFLEIVFTLL